MLLVNTISTPVRTIGRSMTDDEKKNRDYLRDELKKFETFVETCRQFNIEVINKISNNSLTVDSITECLEELDERIDFADKFKSSILIHIQSLKVMIEIGIHGMQSAHETEDDTDEVLKKIEILKNVVTKEHAEIEDSFRKNKSALEAIKNHKLGQVTDTSGPATSGSSDENKDNEQNMKDMNKTSDDIKLLIEDYNSTTTWIEETNAFFESDDCIETGIQESLSYI